MLDRIMRTGLSNGPFSFFALFAREGSSLYDPPTLSSGPTGANNSGRMPVVIESAVRLSIGAGC